MRRPSLFLVVTFFAFILNAQNCELNIPGGNWQGTTTNTSSSVQVSVQANTVEISDFTAGLFTKYGYSGQSITIEFDCDGDLIAKQITSQFGAIDLASGEWNIDEKIIIINWSIITNKIDETTTLTYAE
jgi:hypothetical protein